MFKRVGVFALLLASLTGSLAPTVALAQDGYYEGRNNHQRYDRNWNRHEDRDYGKYERRDRRADEWRDNRWREQEFREHEWRERERAERNWNRGYYPNSYFYFGYGR